MSTHLLFFSAFDNSLGAIARASRRLSKNETVFLYSQGCPSTDRVFTLSTGVKCICASALPRDLWIMKISSAQKTRTCRCTDPDAGFQSVFLNHKRMRNLQPGSRYKHFLVLITYSIVNFVSLMYYGDLNCEI